MKNLKSSILLALINLLLVEIKAQNVGIGTNSPHPTAKLEILTNDSGLLIPRLTTTERDAIVSPADALMIFNLTTRCLEIYNANTNAWVSIGCIDCQLPGNFVATAATGTTSSSFTANWTSSYGSTSYILEVATDAGFTNYVTGFNNLNVGFVTSFNVTGLSCGQTYYYRVKGTNACGTTPVTNVISVTLPASGKVFFNYVSNTYQTWTVPSCVNTITIKAWGAGGGGGGYDHCWGSGVGGHGGGGAYTTTSISVNPGDVLRIYVGQRGERGVDQSTGIGAGAGGWGYGSGANGGNPGSTDYSGPGGGGGGSSAVLNFTTSTLLCVAAGGGGGGGGGHESPCAGGHGGGGGQNGVTSSGTGGVTGGAPNENGTAGGDRYGDGGGGGGGGGGYTNGGTGGDAATCDCGGGGGAGGNSYVMLPGTITNGTAPLPGNSTDPDLCTGCASGGNGGTSSSNSQNGGHGLVVIEY